MMGASAMRARTLIALTAIVQAFTLPACAASPTGGTNVTHQNADVRGGGSAVERSAFPQDTAKEARGRKVLSTAYVRVPAGGVLHVTLRNGQALTLRDVVMNAKDYCGTLTGSKMNGKRFCGGYADVAAAEARLAMLIN